MGAICPGYRDLQDVLFRDESQRIIKNAQRLEDVQPHAELEVLAHTDSSSTEGASCADAPALRNPAVNLHVQLGQPLHEVGANFFFAKYAFDLPPFFRGYTSWISQNYFGGNPVLKHIIEAVGMAGISNTTNSPTIMSQAKERYQQSIERVQEAFQDPVERVTDETFLAVLLLAFFETVSFESWDRYSNWLEHIETATSLLELRGRGQFNRAVGAQLFFLVRTQILSACMFRQLSVPPALVQASWNFQSGPIRDQLREHHVASPGSMSEISLRLVNLRAVAKRAAGPTQEVRDAARSIDDDLMMWCDVVPTEWQYHTVEGSGDRTFNGKRHVYHMWWAAEVWNNWRLIRIAAHQVLLLGDEGESADAAVQLIQHMSEDICISVSAFLDYPRRWTCPYTLLKVLLTFCAAGILTLIRPLYIVAMETRNEHRVRVFAVQQLRRLGVEMGVRHAVLIADTIERYISALGTEAGSGIVCEDLPLTTPY